MLGIGALACAAAARQVAGAAVGAYASDAAFRIRLALAAGPLDGVATLEGLARAIRVDSAFAAKFACAAYFVDRPREVAVCGDRTFNKTGKIRVALPGSQLGAPISWAALHVGVAELAEVGRRVAAARVNRRVAVGGRSALLTDACRRVATTWKERGVAVGVDRATLAVVGRSVTRTLVVQRDTVSGRIALRAGASAGTSGANVSGRAVRIRGARGETGFGPS